MEIKLRLCALMCTVYMCVVHMGLGMCALSHIPVVPLPHPALLPHPLPSCPWQSFVQAVSHNVGVMEEYMEQSERQLEPSQLRKVLKALPSFLRVRPVSTSGGVCMSWVLCIENPPTCLLPRQSSHFSLLPPLLAAAQIQSVTALH